MHDETYADMAFKFVVHFLSIASATIHAGGNTGMWDEEDGFFYDVLRLPDGNAQRLKVRSMVGLLPLCAVTVFEGEFRGRVRTVIVPRNKRSIPRGTLASIFRQAGLTSKDAEALLAGKSLD